MKRQDSNKLESMSLAELTQELQKKQVELALKRQEKKVGRLANPRQVSHLSDEIARLKTVLRRQQLAEVSA